MTKIGFNKTSVGEKDVNYGSTNTTARTTKRSSESSSSSVSISMEDISETKIQRGSILLGFYIVLYACFLISGAAVFSSLEAPKEMEVRGNLMKMRADFLTRFPNVKDEDLENFIVEVVKASNRGVSAAKNVSGEPNWSFGQSLFFSSTVVTTIGYGHVTPLSRTGKVFCMLYALVGIPLTLVLLTALVDRLLISTTWILSWLNSRLGHLYQPFNIRLLHFTLVVTVLGCLFLVAPAGIFAAIEPDWDFLDSFYYCFISLTTIGLGDYIPGDSADQPYRPLYKVATTCYLFIGITFMMLTLTVFYDIPQLNLGNLFTLNGGSTSDFSTCPEKVRLAGAGLGSQYGLGDVDETTRIVRVRSRRDDSPSPEDTTPVHARVP